MGKPDEEKNEDQKEKLPEYSKTPSENPFIEQKPKFINETEIEHISDLKLLQCMLKKTFSGNPDDL